MGKNHDELMSKCRSASLYVIRKRYHEEMGFFKKVEDGSTREKVLPQ